MTGIPLAFGSSARRIGRFPVFTLENLYAEAAPSNQERGLALISRPGLTALASVSTGPIRGVYQQAGVFGGDAFVLSHLTLYRVTGSGAVTALSGTIPGTERVSIAAGLNSLGNAEVRIANGIGLYLYDGTTVSAETFIETAGASAIDYLRGMWIATRSDTQELCFRFLDDASWTALAFQSAEYTPDKVVGVTHLGDQMIVAGEASIELFGLSGDAAFPLSPYGAGLVNDIGCINRDSIVRVGDAVYLVTDTCQVLRLSPSPEIVSDPAVTEVLRGAAPNTIVGWGYERDGYAHYVLASDAGSFIYRRGPGFTGWSSASSLGYGYWRPGFGVQLGTRVICGDGPVGTGQLWILDSEVFSDDGSEIVRTATGFLEIKEGRLEVFNIRVGCAVGFAPQAGQGSAPLLQMRVSRDGQTWGDWREVSLGAYGQFDTRAKLNRWGQFRPPGVLVQVRCSEPVEHRITDVRANVSA